jgi:hypothetical protein
VDGTLLATVDTTEFTTPTGGDNILFGHSDINAGISADPNYAIVQFTLVDNVQVSTVSAVDDADFDGDGDIDGADFLTWQRNVGAAGNQSQGNANGDGTIDAADLAIWKTQFGNPPPAAASAGAVPEPGTWLLAALAAVACLGLAAPRRRHGLAHVVVRK